MSSYLKSMLRNRAMGESLFVAVAEPIDSNPLSRDRLQICLPESDG